MKLATRLTGRLPELVKLSLQDEEPELAKLPYPAERVPNTPST